MTRPVSSRPQTDGPSRRALMFGALAAAAAAAVPLRASGAEAVAQAAQSPVASSAGALKVMTFNIRYGTAKDGEDHWDKRKDFLVDVIRAEAPHVLGVQEG